MGGDHRDRDRGRRELVSCLIEGDSRVALGYSNNPRSSFQGVRLSSGALHRTTLGHIVNLLSTDVAKLDMVIVFHD